MARYLEYSLLMARYLTFANMVRYLTFATHGSLSRIFATHGSLSRTFATRGTLSRTFATHGSLSRIFMRTGATIVHPRTCYLMICSKGVIYKKWITTRRVKNTLLV